MTPGAAHLVIDRQQANCKMLGVIGTDPSLLRSEPEQTDKPHRKPLKGL
jgi:hypothetical protein